MEGKKSTLHQDWWSGRAEVVVSGRTWRARGADAGRAEKRSVFFLFISFFLGVEI
jgi:membrane protein implicated in regulation of membrane protease activity